MAKKQSAPERRSDGSYRAAHRRQVRDAKRFKHSIR